MFLVWTPQHITEFPEDLYHGGVTQNSPTCTRPTNPQTIQASQDPMARTKIRPQEVLEEVADRLVLTGFGEETYHLQEEIHSAGHRLLHLREDLLRQ